MSTNRTGKHKEGKTLLGAYVTDEVKALAVMTSDKLGITITDIILNGLRSEAYRAGLTDEQGKIRDEYKDVFYAIRELCIAQRKERKRK